MSRSDLPRTREEFRRFVLTHHPDRGGDPATFAAGVTAWRRQQSTPTAPVFFYRKRTILAQLCEQLRNLLPAPRQGARANDRRARR